MKIKMQIACGIIISILFISLFCLALGIMLKRENKDMFAYEFRVVGRISEHEVIIEDLHGVNWVMTLSNDISGCFVNDATIKLRK